MKSKNLRIEEGIERNAEWRALSTAEQLASLDRRLGKGVGAKRQRTKFDALLHPPVSSAPDVLHLPEPIEPVEPAKKKKFKKGNRKKREERE